MNFFIRKTSEVLEILELIHRTLVGSRVAWDVQRLARLLESLQNKVKWGFVEHLVSASFPLE